jgi:hypothetical protein
MEDTIRKTFEDYKEKTLESRIWIFKLIVSQVNLKLEGLWGMDIPWVQVRRILYMGRPTRARGQWAKQTWRTKQGLYCNLNHLGDI